MTHPHFSTGLPCNCAFTRFEPKQPVISSVKVADKLHDFLMNPKSRPDLQTPKGQKLLDALKRFHTDKTDALMPWLVREWKKGRLQEGASGSWLEDALADHPVGRALPDELKDRLRRYHEGQPSEPTGVKDMVPDPPQSAGNLPGLYDQLIGEQHPHTLFYTPPHRVRAEGGVGHEAPLHPGNLQHWADFLQSNHPLRRDMGDIMKHDITSFNRRIHDWDAAMKAEAQDRALRNGEVVHTTPDNWTVRRLHTAEELKHEGSVMGHCVGSYAVPVERGDALIYSLRDPEHHPHATMEIIPRRWQDPPNEDGSPGQIWGSDGGDPSDFNMTPVPHNGEIVQIQGKSDEVPKPEYQERLKHWFQSFPEEQRPNWADRRGTIEHIGGIYPEAQSYNSDIDELEHGEPSGGEGGYGPHGDYGLVEPHRAIDYPSVIDSLIRPKSYDEWHSQRRGSDWPSMDFDQKEVEALYQEALRRKEIPQLAEAAEKYRETADSELLSMQDQWEMNDPSIPNYPGESWDEDPEQWQEIVNKKLNDEYDWHNPYHDVETPEDAFEVTRGLYDEQQQELYNSHPPSQLSSALYAKLNPHYHPTGWAMTDEGPKSSGYYNPTFDPEMGQLNPQQLDTYLNGTNPGQNGGTFSKVANVDLRSLPLHPILGEGLKESLANPIRFKYHHLKTTPDWGGVDRYRFGVEPVGGPARYEYTSPFGPKSNKVYSYDPQVVSLRDGEFGADFHYHDHPEWKQPAYLDENRDLVRQFERDVPPEEGMLYRGLSHEEWEQAKQRGYFDSNRTHNIGGEEGTMFSTDPGQAESYAAGFAPWFRKPGFQAPSYVIAVPRPADAYPHPHMYGDTNETVVPSQVPFNQVQNAWQFRPAVIQHGDMDVRSEDYGKTYFGQPYFQTFNVYRPMPLDHRMSKLATPLYKRWVFSPATGEVELSDNGDNPLQVRYHTDLATRLNEPNLVHGYAYRIGNGWRLTDWDSQPVSDNYIVAQVMRKLQADEGSSGPQEGWETVSDDWDRCHHGMPS